MRVFDLRPKSDDLVRVIHAAAHVDLGSAAAAVAVNDDRVFAGNQTLKGYVFDGASLAPFPADLELSAGQRVRALKMIGRQNVTESARACSFYSS